MATLSRTNIVISYASGSGGVNYTFDVVLDAQGLITIRNVLGPGGSPCGSGIPETVLDDMQEAKLLVQLLLGETEVASGTLSFATETQLPAVIAGGTLNNTNYRVAYDDPNGNMLATENKTVTGFDAVVGVAYGTIAVPIDVDYSVLVSTAQNSFFGGSATFVVGDAGTIAVAFPTAVTTTDYRVLLAPDGFFIPRVINKAITGFTIELGHGLAGAETAVVGYDVFA